MKLTKEILDASYKRIHEFNTLAGALEGNLEASIDLQLSLCFEEIAEAIEAFEQRDPANLLKEACDSWVVVVGLLQKLEAAGFNVAEAIERVDINNLSKMPHKGNAISYDNQFKATLNEKYNRWVIKDANGKIRKPLTYEKVDVSDLAPNTFFLK